MDVLEYLVRLRGAESAAAQVRGVARAMGDLAREQGRVAASGDAAAASTGKLHSALGIAAKGVAGLGAAAIGVGFEAFKMASNFNHEMLRIRTDAGASTAELNRMKRGVLELAASGQSMGQGPMSLAQGLYHLESLGIRGSRALMALKLASQESAISGANLEETTSALGAAMYTGIKGTGDLTHLMGVLNATVGAGNMRFQDLVEALGTGVLPSAKVAGLSIQDVSAALAVATDAGYKASSAAAQLGTAFHFLYSPSDVAKKALKAIGMSSTELAVDMHRPEGLLVALRDLRGHLAGLSKVQQAQVLNAILPGGRGRILLTELTMLDRLRGKYEQINKTAGGFTGAVAMQRQDPQTQLATQWAKVQARMISLGNTLKPLVLPALAALLKVGVQLVNWLISLAKWIENGVHWFQKHKDAARALAMVLLMLGTVLALIAVRMIAARIAAELWAAAVALLNLVMDANPIGLVILAIAALVVGIIYAYHHFKWFRDAVIDGWNWIKTAFGDALTFVESLPDRFGKAATAIWHAITSVFSSLGSFFSGVFQGAVNIAIGVLNWFIARINDMINAVNSVTGSLPLIGGALHIGTIGSITPVGASATPAASATPIHQTPGSPGHVKGLAGGGTLRTGGLVMVGERGRELLNLPRGAQVTPMHKAGFGGSGDVIFQFGEHEVGRMLKREFWKAMAANA